MFQLRVQWLTKRKAEKKRELQRWWIDPQVSKAAAASSFPSQGLLFLPISSLLLPFTQEHKRREKDVAHRRLDGKERGYTGGEECRVASWSRYQWNSWAQPSSILQWWRTSQKGAHVLNQPAEARVLSFSKHKVQKFEYSDKFRMGKTF